MDWCVTQKKLKRHLVHHFSLITIDLPEKKNTDSTSDEKVQLGS